MNTAKASQPLVAAFPWAVVLAAIWGPVVYLLGAQWLLYPEYQYGWAVPGLCLFLAWQKLPSRPAANVPQRKRLAVVGLMSAGLAFWLMRVLQEANPIWRLASWGLALAAVAITLLLVYLAQGRHRAAHFLFPALFFLVAVPWPTPVESFVVQNLTRFNAGLVTDVMNLIGVPALQHGNVIEVSSGMVGIDEACSGIRSLQATVMIALFFGEFFGLHAGGRWLLLGAGPALAVAFNLVRTFILVLIAARTSIPSMERWHDLTGVILLVGCFLSLWGLGEKLARIRARRAKALQSAVTGDDRGADGRKPANAGGSRSQNIRISKLAVGVLVWAFAVEVSTEAWFRSHQSRDSQVLSWTARWPLENPTLRTNSIPQKSLDLLQCDEQSAARWDDSEGNSWQAFFLHWRPAGSFYGRAKEALSKYHNPTDCLPASGLKLRAQLDPVRLEINPGFSLAFHRYVFTTGDSDWYVFFSQTEDVTDNGPYTLRTTHLDRFRAAWAGSRNYGQNNFEVVIAGPKSPDDALRLFGSRLPELIVTTPAGH